MVFPVSLAKVDGGTVTKCNFAGDEQAGASWTDKIMANKANTGNTQSPGGEGAGAEEDEWVRTFVKSKPSKHPHIIQSQPENPNNTPTSFPQEDWASISLTSWTCSALSVEVCQLCLCTPTLHLGLKLVKA